MDKTFGEIVRAERERRGLSQQALADMAHTSQQAIDRIERGVTKRSPSGPNIAAALGIEFPLGMNSQVMAVDQAYTPRIDRSELVGLPDLPIYSAVRGGSFEDSILVSAEPIDYVKRPEPLARAKNGYGLYVLGTSMIPAYRHGDLVLVHPNLPYGAGDDVVISTEDSNGEHYAILKHLQRMTADRWHLEQYNPPDGEPAEFSLERNKWPTCHLVVGSYRKR